MSLPINVRASVINLLSDTPQSDDIFLVDTNVWVWQTYSHAGAASRIANQKISEYTPYLKQTLDCGATLAYSSLILSELAFVIEKTECAIFNRRNKCRLRPKEFLPVQLSLRLDWIHCIGCDTAILGRLQ